jgi:hypothetical protein
VSVSRTAGQTHEVKPWGPGPCSDCQQRDSVDNYQTWGCGWREKYASNASVQFVRGAADAALRDKDTPCPAEGRTCPWFYRVQPFVQSIFSLVGDWDEGRLGAIWDLPAHLVDYLRVASAEFKTWQAENERQIMAAAK